MSVADQTTPASSLPRRIPLAVRLSPLFVNRLCARLQKASPDQPHIAGLLFGIAGEGLAIVQAFKSFTPPDSNESLPVEGERLVKAFERSMAAAQTDPEVSALDLIGWYSLRPSGGLHAADIDFHNSRFRRPNDLALILRPQGVSDVLLELYTRVRNAVLSPEEHRWGALRLATDVPVLGPIEITMRTTAADELNEFELLDRALEREERKSGLRARARIPLSVLRPKRTPPGETADAAARDSAGTAPSPPIDAKIVRAAQPGAVRERQAASDSAALVHRITAGEPPGLPALLPPPKRSLPWVSSAILCAVLFAVFAGVTFVFLFVHGLPSGTATPAFLRAILPDAGLGLRVETQGDRVLLSWNRRNAVVRAATMAVLHIDDGPQHRDFTMNAAQATNGAVLYRPRSDDVTFHLEVRGQQGATVADSIRVLDGVQNSPLDLSAAPQAQPPAPKDVAAEPAEHHDWKPVPVAKTVTEAKAVQPPVTPQPEQPPPAGNLTAQSNIPADQPPIMRSTSLAGTPSVSTVPRDSVPSPRAEIPVLVPSSANAAKPPENSTAALGTDKAAPPVSVTTAPLPATAPLVQNPQRSDGTPPIPSPERSDGTPPHKSADASKESPGSVWDPALGQTDSPSQAASQEPTAAKPAVDNAALKAADSRPGNSGQPAPAAQTQTAPPAASSPLGARRDNISPDDFRPAHAVHQVLPDTSLFPPSFILASPQVEVSVRVDQNGRVIDARVLNGKKKVKQAVATAVLIAAKQWTFEPATVSGHAVPSDHTIVFQFRPE